MSSPSPITTVQRPDLAVTLMEYDLQAAMAGYRGLELMPVFEAAEQSANIGRIPLEQLLNESDDARQSDGGYNRDNFQFDELFYATQDRGFEQVIDDRLKRIYRRYFDAEVVAARRARNKVLANQEKRICTLLNNTGAFTNEAAAAVWSNHSSATPISDVKKRLIAVRNASGQIPNAVAMEWEAYMHATQCDEVLDRIANTNPNQPKLVNAQTLAKAFEVQKVVVFETQKNTKNPGQSGFTLASQWTRTQVGVGRVATPGDNDVINPCVGRSFHWAEDGSEIGATIEEYYSNDKRSNIIRARMDIDERLMYQECWQLITGVL
jgi:hypothetical protein